MTRNHINGKQILGKLISINTVNDPQKMLIPDVEILDYVKDLIAVWNPDIKAKIFRDQSYASIYLTPNLDNGADILFMGHLDVVPVTDGWSSDPFSLRIENDRAYGRGSKDCKGSVVSCLLMYQDLCQQQVDGFAKIGFFFSTDEETGGQHGAKLFFDEANKQGILPKFVINVDGGSRVVYKRRAGFGVSLIIPPVIKSVNGKIEKLKTYTKIFGDPNRHSAYFVRGVDQHAILTLSKLLHLNRNWKIQDLTGSWIKKNVIPDDCVATVVKPTSNGSIQTYDEHLTAILRAMRGMVLLDGTQLETEIPSEFGITVNPNIVTYSSTNGTQVEFDVRAFLSPEKAPILVHAIKSRLNAFSINADIETRRSSGYLYTSKEHLLVTTASSVLEKHSMVSEPCEQEGASDARYPSSYNIPVIDLGPEGGAIHGTDEFIMLKSMNDFAMIYKDIVRQLIPPNLSLVE
ncbi:MAG: M20/M25/M40 family metallo-hydrolase [Candidatus Thorarchaeota archaeon]